MDENLALVRSAIRDVFSDGGWHTARECKSRVFYLVDPRIAIRRYLNQSEVKQIDSQDQQILWGQKRAIQCIVSNLYSSKELERRKPESGLMEYRIARKET